MLEKNSCVGHMTLRELESNYRRNQILLEHQKISQIAYDERETSWHRYCIHAYGTHPVVIVPSQCCYCVQELEHSGAQLAAIEMSKERLLKAKSEYGDQHSLLSKSKGLIKVINWQNKSERYLLWAGLLLFCLVATYIIQKRFLYFVPHSMRPMALLRYVAHMLYYVFKKKNTSQQEEEDEHTMHSTTIPAPDEL